LRSQTLKITLAALVLVLAACQQGAPRLEFEGVSLIDGTEYPLTLSVSRYGERLMGEYRVKAAKGTFQGTVTDTVITAELTPGPNCTYSFEGELTETTLTGTFEPTACPGGQTGTWDLALR